jgi:hypothetical protein
MIKYRMLEVYIGWFFLDNFDFYPVKCNPYVAALGVGRGTGRRARTIRRAWCVEDGEATPIEN